jgi:AraC family transcriptional regulator, ethanolamine operon transcriptional activator
VRGRQPGRHRRIVDRFEEIARTNIGRFAHIADLCREAGVTPRTLSRAFRAVRGTTPYRFLKELRLSEVRRALSSDVKGGTITEVAMRFGFHELGRFAAQYRERFGESPSQTRRRALLPASHDGAFHCGRDRGHSAT